MATLWWFAGILAFAFVEPFDGGKVGKEIVDAVEQRFYDAVTARQWAQRHRELGRGVTDPQVFATQVRAALKSLNASHTSYYTPLEPQSFGLQAIFQQYLKATDVAYDSIGVDLAPEGVVRVVFAGGPAHLAGIKRGDQIVSVNGKPPHPILSFQGKANTKVTITLRRQANEPPLTLDVVPRTVDPRQEWLKHQREGAVLTSEQGKTIAYAPMFSCAGPVFQELLEELLTGPLARADALVIDFRDGWGGCNPGFVNLFNTMPPILTSRPRDGKELVLDQQWRKPLVILINEGTRSGKEAVSFALKRHQRARLVGRQSAGAVLAGSPTLLSDGSLLLLAVADVLVDGQRLEGIGVEPDLVIEDRLKYADGTDPQREAAVKEAARLALIPAKAP